MCKAFKYSWRESATGGVGMMARGEVALIVTAAVINEELLGAYALPKDFMIMTVLLILISSVLTPILLKVLYGNGTKKGRAAKQAVAQTATAGAEINEAPETDADAANEGSEPAQTPEQTEGAAANN